MVIGTAWMAVEYRQIRVQLLPYMDCVLVSFLHPGERDKMTIHSPYTEVTGYGFVGIWLADHVARL